MQGDEARILLGFSPDSRPTLPQIKAAYRKKVWESHPDLFPAHEKSQAESKFKLISEAYSYLLPVCVTENDWNSLFHCPPYVAAYFLNQSYQYRSDFQMNPEVIRGLNECIIRLEADNGKRISESMQIPDFASAKADSGTDLAIST